MILQIWIKTTWRQRYRAGRVDGNYLPILQSSSEPLIITISSNARHASQSPQSKTRKRYQILRKKTWCILLAVNESLASATDHSKLHLGYTRLLFIHFIDNNNQQLKQHQPSIIFSRAAPFRRSITYYIKHNTKPQETRKPCSQAEFIGPISPKCQLHYIREPLWYQRNEKANKHIHRENIGLQRRSVCKWRSVPLSTYMPLINLV